MGEDRKVGIMILVAMFLIGLVVLLAIFFGETGLFIFVGAAFAIIVYMAVITVIHDTDPIKWHLDKIEERLNRSGR